MDPDEARETWNAVWTVEPVETVLSRNFFATGGVLSSDGFHEEEKEQMKRVRVTQRPVADRGARRGRNVRGPASERMAVRIAAWVVKLSAARPQLHGF